MSGADAGIVVADDRSAEARRLPTDRGIARTEDLATVAGALLASRAAGPLDVSLIGAVVGPGSYTGLRSGLAFLRGLAFSRKLPAVAVGALELLAWREAREGETVLAVWPAGKGQSVVGTFRRGSDDVEELQPPRTIADDEVPAFVRESGVRVAVTPSSAVAGLAGDVEVRVTRSESFATLADLVRSRAKRGKTTATGELVPVYVREAVLRPSARTHDDSATCE